MPPAALQPLPEALLTVDLKGIVGLELAGSRLTEHRKHVHEVVEGEVPLPVLRKSLHNPFLEGILLKTTIAITMGVSLLGGSWGQTAMPYVTLDQQSDPAEPQLAHL